LPLNFENRKLKQLDPPIPSRNRQTKNLTLIRGSTGTCPCLLDAYPAIQSVSWYRNGISIRIEPKGNLQKKKEISFEEIFYKQVEPIQLIPNMVW
jgi:hypothetical protein